MEQLGNLCIYLYLINPAMKGQDPDDVLSRRMRRVVLLRAWQVSRDDAQKITTQFLQENCLENKDLYQTHAVWTVTDYL